MFKLRLAKKAAGLAIMILLASSICGCALISTALSAAAAYGIYQATNK